MLFIDFLFRKFHNFLFHPHNFYINLSFMNVIIVLIHSIVPHNLQVKVKNNLNTFFYNLLRCFKKKNCDEIQDSKIDNTRMR